MQVNTQYKYTLKFVVCVILSLYISIVAIYRDTNIFLLSMYTENVAPTATHEMALLRQQLEAEKEKGALKDDTINLLKEDKAYLQSELARKDEFIRELVSNKEEIPGPSGYSGWWLSFRIH